MTRLSGLALVAGLSLAFSGAVRADGIVSTVVNAPLSASGTVQNARVGINVYLQSPEAPGIEFMDPKVVGYGIPEGGRLEVEMAEGFERDWAVGLSQAAFMLVTGAPQQGSGKIDFLASPVPQILPTNFPQGRRNHNWQRVKSGTTLGQTEGTVPVTLMLYAKAQEDDPDKLYAFTEGIVGAGVLSTQQLRAAGYEKPVQLARYNGGLILQDSNGDGALEPGKRWGGAMMQVRFTAGSKPGKYRPTLALLRDPGDLASGDGSAYTYTIVVE